MPKLSMQFPHAWPHDAAVEFFRGKFTKLRAKFGDQVSNLEEQWEGTKLRFGFSTFGMKVKGLAAVEPSHVLLDLDLPLAAMMFKARIEQEVRNTMERWLAQGPTAPSPTEE